MYVCVCSALNEKKVHAALEAGAKSPAAIFKHHGATLQCGKCVGMMREMAAECAGRRRSAASVPANDVRESEVVYGVAAE